jgi:hypothetical protein
MLHIYYELLRLVYLLKIHIYELVILIYLLIIHIWAWLRRVYKFIIHIYDLLWPTEKLPPHVVMTSLADIQDQDNCREKVINL